MRYTTWIKTKSSAFATLLATFVSYGGAMMLETCFSLEVAGQKNEANLLKVQNSVVQANVQVGGNPGVDNSAGNAPVQTGTPQRGCLSPPHQDQCW